MADIASERGQPVGFDHRSRWIDLSGPVHYLDFGGPPDGPSMVAVHGLGGSALNWSAIAPMVTTRCRLIAPDLAGHGLTESLGRPTTVAANRGLLHEFLSTVTTGPVTLMGNSMGGMISLLEADAYPDRVAGLVLLGAALPFVPALPDPLVAAAFAVYAAPGLGTLIMHWRRRMSPDRIVATIMKLCCVDPGRIPVEVVAEHVEMARLRTRFAGIDRDLLAAGRSVVATAGAPPGTRYRRVIRSIRAPVLLVHGDRDRLVPVAASIAATRANPSWQLVVLPGVGHVPQLEAPAETAAAIFDWLDGAGPGSAM